jgi:uncharacterized membrane protein YhaH (DUF805 family)
MPLNSLLFSFQGRIRRSQWWAVRLSMVAAVFVLFMVFGILGGAFQHDPNTGTGADVSPATMVLGLLFLLVLPLALWISLATGVKRLHDQDLSGWMILICFIPIIGGFFTLICLGCLDGKPGRNQYGPSPKYPETPAAAATFS